LFLGFSSTRWLVQAFKQDTWITNAIRVVRGYRQHQERKDRANYLLRKSYIAVINRDVDKILAVSAPVQ
jgi:hypothetical protein